MRATLITEGTLVDDNGTSSSGSSGAVRGGGCQWSLSIHGGGIKGPGRTGRDRVHSDRLSLVQVAKDAFITLCNLISPLCVCAHV